MEDRALPKLKKIYVQVGAGAGDLDTREDVNCRDGFTELVKALDASEIDKIVLVEPNPINIPLLIKCWEKYNSAMICHIGISTSLYADSYIRFYYAEEDAPHYQTFSMSKKHVQDHYPESELKHTDVHCVTLSKVLEKTIGLDAEIELLALDVEGIDAEILLDTDWSKIKCKNLSFEYIHITNALLLISICNHLAMHGFRFVGKGVDVNGYDVMFRRTL
jgi:FkbM family methyltransferase